MEDGELLALYEKRDEDAVAMTKAEYGAHLIGISLNIVKNPQDAEECVNDTYLRAWNLIPPERPLPFFPWLAKVTRNLSLSLLEKKNAQKRSATLVELTEELGECFPSDEEVERSFDALTVRRVLDAYLGEQSEERSFLFVRRYFYGDSFADIARWAGKTPGSVRSVLFRMRGELRQRLEQEGIEP